MNEFKVLLLLICVISITVTQSQKPFYCQAPLPNPSENTNGLTLKMVQVVTRHGDRTPLYSTMNGLMDEWNCTLGSYMLPSQGNNGETLNNVDLLYRKVYLPGREYLPGNCSLGQLTALGYQQHINLGQAFRSLYVYKYALLSETLDESEIWVRSTDVPRTLQSAQGHLTGLYPPGTTGETGQNSVNIIDIFTMDSYFENMEPNNNLCPILVQYYYNNTDSQTYYQFNKENYNLKKEIEQALDINKAPDWSDLMDLFFATQCHGFDLPPGITESVVNATYQASLWENNYLLSPSIVNRLSMSTFFEEIINNIEEFISGNITTKYFIFSGHDDTVGPLMMLFGIDQYWPPYASHVEFELWEDDNSNKFIQLKYNGVSIEVSGCSSTMCPIDEFFETAYSILVPDYSDACQPTSSSNESGSVWP